MALLEPRLAILDETDSGLDIDALRVVAGGVNQLSTKDNAIVLVTHYQRLLNYIVPDYVHVMDGGPHRQDRRQGPGARTRDARLRLGRRGIEGERQRHDDAAGPRRRGYLESLLQGSRSCRRARSAWLNELRAEAVDRVGALTVPTTRDEEWRFTDISPLTRLSFQPVRAAHAAARPAIADRFHLDEAATRLVFVDGVLRAGALARSRRTASSSRTSPTAAAAHAAAIERASRPACRIPRQRVRGAQHRVPARRRADHRAARRGASRRRCICCSSRRRRTRRATRAACVVAEPGSAVTVIEDFVALQDDAYFTNAVTEIALAAQRARRSRPGAARQRPGVPHRATARCRSPPGAASTR